jgi:hypothetical protein
VGRFQIGRFQKYETAKLARPLTTRQRGDNNNNKDGYVIRRFQKYETAKLARPPHNSPEGGTTTTTKTVT